MLRLVQIIAVAAAALSLAGCGAARPDRPGAREEALSRGSLMATVRVLASPPFEGRRPGTLGSKKAQAYLVDSFRNAGLDPVPNLGYRHRFRGGVNVVGMLAGAGPRSDEVVVVGAHYDHLGSRGDSYHPGANDNASGVSALVAAARSLAAAPPASRRTVLFVAFDAEEAGLIGSKAFVEDPPVKRGRIVSAIILDMVGARPYAGAADRLAVVGTEKSPELEAVAAAVAPVPGLDVVRLGVQLIDMGGERVVSSDHAPFRDAGIPFAFLTTGLCETYHQTTDTPDRLAPDLLASVASWVDRFLRGVVQHEVRPRFEHAREDPVEDLRHVTRLLRAALDPARPLMNSLVRPEKLRAHLDELDGFQRRVARGARLAAEELTGVRRALLRLSCYAAGPDSPMASVCNAF